MFIFICTHISIYTYTHVHTTERAAASRTAKQGQIRTQPKIDELEGFQVSAHHDVVRLHISVLQSGAV